ETKRPSKEMQVTIARQLGLEPSTVGNFFMNARRRSMDKWKDDNESNPNKMCAGGGLGGGGGGGGGGATMVHMAQVPQMNPQTSAMVTPRSPPGHLKVTERVVVFVEASKASSALHSGHCMYDKSSPGHHPSAATSLIMARQNILG
ncbi:hypothetical protein Pmani_032222, partial [Petrolisthes manimaculis]